MINEVLSNPKSTWNCSEPQGSYSQSTDSWVELYNPQSQPLDLYAARAQISVDGGSNLYLFPFGTAIAPGGFLVVFPLAGLHTYPPANWNVMLAFGGTIIDQVNLPTLVSDQSYARVPDGKANWQLVGQPTIDASNNASGQPVTATPTKTPSPTKTPKAPKGTGSPGSTEANTPTNTGTQPAWGQLQLPPDTTPGTQPSAISPPAFNQNPPVAQNAALDSEHIALFATLLLLLCGVLAWCWRLFHTP
jgi:hypothetical protein